jgi:putative ABC transport system permease protein
MFNNYLKVALRNFVKHRTYSSINLGGLGIAVAVCLLIGLFVRQEWTFDRFHAKADRIYRPWLYEKYESEEFISLETPHPLGPTLKSTYPEVEAVTHYMATNSTAKKGAEVFTERMHLVDPDFLRMFSFPLVQTTGPDPLNEPGSVVLTEEMARKYFGAENALGKRLEIRLDGDTLTLPFTVTAVARDWPQNSSFQFGFLLPYENAKRIRSPKTLTAAWHNIEPDTYVLLREGTDAQRLESKFPEMVHTVLGEKYKPGEYTVHLQALADIHLRRGVPEAAGSGEVAEGEAQYSYILATIALFILTIACINFVTLSIGRSGGRAREVGVRKTMGAGRLQLLNQFWGEAVLLILMAVGVGVAATTLLLPAFNGLIGTRLALTLEPFTVLFLLGVVAVIGLVAGSYPALVLSAFRPVEVLKGKLSVKGDTSLFRRSLVVVQFGLSVFLIVGTLVMNQQLSFIRNKSLGYRTGQTVVVEVPRSGEAGRQMTERFRNALQSRKEVESVSASAFPFAAGNWGEGGYTDKNKVYREFRFNAVDEHFLPAYGVELVAGRNFDARNSADQFGGYIVNEAFVKAMGWKNPLHERIPGKFPDHRIIGVVKDFHFESLHGRVQPLLLAMRLDSMFKGLDNLGLNSPTRPDISVRLTAGDLPGRVALLASAWKAAVPNEPFAYSFLDQNVQDQYQLEERLGKLVTIASGLSIFIACLGLFGLATLAVARRTKEIGIRKVLGASEGQLVHLLSRDFLLLILLAMALAWPVAWYVMHGWLADFAYKIDLHMWVFAASGVIALLIAAFTLILQVLRAARANPVKSLRSE